MFKRKNALDKIIRFFMATRKTISINRKQTTVSNRILKETKEVNSIGIKVVDRISKIYANNKKRVFIVGGGPSLKNFDFKQLEGEDIIATNNSIRYLDSAKYFITVDYTFFGKSKITIDEINKKTDYSLFVLSNADFIKNISGTFVDTRFNYRYDKLHKIDYVIKSTGVTDYKTGFGKTLANFKQGANSGYAAIQLALLLEYEEIYLLGFDMDENTSEINFYRDYKTDFSKFKSKLPRFRQNIIDGIELGNIKNIYNVNNPDSKLNGVIENVTLDEVLSNKIPDKPISTNAVKGINRNKTLSDVIFVAYYTLGTPYEQEAANLKKTLEKWDLNYDIVGVPNLGNWQKNTRYKAQFMLDMLDKHKGYKLVYVDSDARIQQRPTLFEDYDCDVAVRWQDFKWRQNECLSGTIYFDNNEKTREVCKRWLAKNDSRDTEKLEQWNLGDILQDMFKKGEISMKNLPPEYTFIYDIMGRMYPNLTPVIEHFQASRKLKGRVLGKSKDTKTVSDMNVARKHPTKFHFLVNGWNCKRYVRECIDSIINQNNASKYDYDIHILDDASTDGTWDEINRYRELYNIRIYRNEKNMGAAYSRMRLFKELDAGDEDVIILVDLDDYIDKKVLDVISKEYDSNKELELTYGTLKRLDNNKTYSGGVIPMKFHVKKDYENYRYVGTHVRTFKVRLRKGLIEDLFKLDGKWLMSATDVPLMLMLMKFTNGVNSIKNITEVLYYYRGHSNPNGIFKKESGDKKQFDNAKRITEKIKRNYKKPKINDTKKSEINSIVDKVYVINLDKDVEKFNKIKKQLDSLGIEFERFSAVNGSEFPENKKKEIRSRFIHGKGMLENEFALGCAMSHLNIIKDAKVNNYSRILILEDDAIFHKNFVFEISKIENIKDFDFLYLGASQHNWNNIKIENGKYKLNKTYGCFGYIINSRMYDLILENYKEILSIDNFYLKLISDKNLNKSWVLYPNLIIADVSNSNLRESRNQVEHSKKMKWDLKNYNL